jgi:hypothetical protein
MKSIYIVGVFFGLHHQFQHLSKAMQIGCIPCFSLLTSILSCIEFCHQSKWTSHFLQFWNAESTSRRRMVKEELEDVLLGELQFPCSAFLVSTNFPMHTYQTGLKQFMSRKCRKLRYFMRWLTCSFHVMTKLNFPSTQCPGDKLDNHLVQWLHTMMVLSLFSVLTAFAFSLDKFAQFDRPIICKSCWTHCTCTTSFFTKVPGHLFIV